MARASSCMTIIGVILMIARVQCIMWYLEPNSHKCLKEEVQANTVIQGEYQASFVAGQKVDYVIRDSNEQILSQKADIQQGKMLKFSFSTENYDVYEICFYSHVPPQQRGLKQEITLIVKKGIEAKSYEGIGEAAKLKPIEVELKRLEDLSEAIVQDFARMRSNEEKMRDTHEVTNSRVLYFSIFSLICLVVLATWQVFYLRSFFKTKKLIE